MEPILTRIRALLATGVPVAAFIAITWSFPSQAECQTEQGCDIGDIESVTDDDGTVWLCVSEIECPTWKGRNVCMVLGGA